MKIRWRDSHIAQLWHFEHENVCVIFGVMEAAFVVAFERFFFGTASEQPVIFCDAEFLVHLTTHRHAVVATRTTRLNERIQSLFGLGGQSLQITL